MTKPNLDPKTKRLTTITESHSTDDTIDLRIPHQLVVSHILGAIICDRALRIIRPDNRSRPYVTMTDMLADIRGAADLAVSFDGSFKYDLLIEVKTIATWEGPNTLELFNDVTDKKYNEGRNKAQLERLVNVAPSWWYVIVDYSKLTAKTHSEHVRAILDCPALFVEGKHGDIRPIDGRGFNTLSDLLDTMHEKLLKLGISKVKPLPTPYHQMDLLPVDYVPVDDVPVVTMDQPLRQPVVAPVPAPAVAVKRSLPNRAFEPMWQAALREIELCGGFETWSQKLPESLLMTYIGLSKKEPKDRLLEGMERRKFAKQNKHHTQLGTLLIAWLCDSARPAAMLRQAMPEMMYTFCDIERREGHHGELHLIPALANSIRSGAR